MLATLLEPTSGEVRVLGIDVRTHPREIRANLGAMLSGERSLYWKLTARENLEYFAALYHVPPKASKARIAAALVAVKLADRADDYVERYSTGMRQRLALAPALHGSLPPAGSPHAPALRPGPRVFGARGCHRNRVSAWPLGLPARQPAHPAAPHHQPVLAA